MSTLSAVAFFNTVYDPFHNVGLGNGTMDDFPGLARCNGGHNRCTLLDDYEYHAAWATTLYTRFSDGADAVLNRAKLTAHAWLNTTAFIICLVQMHGPTRKKYLDLHRKMGWAAIALVTCGTGCSLWLASDHGDLEYYGGNVAVAGWFVSVAGTLFGTLIPGVLAVLRKDIAGHKKWMTRFYGSMWGAFLVFRLMFLVGRLMAWHKNAMILINIWTCTPIGVLLAEVVRVRSLATDTKTASRRGTMETVDSSSSVKND